MAKIRSRSPRTMLAALLLLGAAGVLVVLLRGPGPSRLSFDAQRPASAGEQAPVLLNSDSPNTRTPLGNPARQDDPAMRTIDARAAAILAAFGRIVLESDRWPPDGGAQDFTQVDMSRLRTCVLELGVDCTELVDLLRRGIAPAGIRAVVLAALAYAPGYSPDTVQVIRDAVRTACPASDALRGTSAHTEDVRTCFAGLFALGMRGPVSDREPLIDDLVALHLLDKGAGTTLRDLATYSLRGVAGRFSTSTLERLNEARQAQAEAYFTSEVLRSLCSAGGDDLALGVLRAAMQADGHSREGLECASSPSLAPELQALVERRSPAVASAGEAYAAALAASAARGMLSIDAECGSSELRRLVQSTDERVLVALHDALQTAPRLAAAGELLGMAADVAGRADRAPISNRINGVLAAIRGQAMRMTVTDRERELCARHLREALPSLKSCPAVAVQALELLVLVDDTIEASSLESELDHAGIREEHRQTVRAAWRVRHPAR